MRISRLLLILALIVSAGGKAHASYQSPAQAFGEQNLPSGSAQGVPGTAGGEDAWGTPHSPPADEGAGNSGADAQQNPWAGAQDPQPAAPQDAWSYPGAQDVPSGNADWMQPGQDPQAADAGGNVADESVAGSAWFQPQAAASSAAASVPARDWEDLQHPAAASAASASSAMAAVVTTAASSSAAADEAFSASSESGDGVDVPQGAGLPLGLIAGAAVAVLLLGIVAGVVVSRLAARRSAAQ